MDNVRQIPGYYYDTEKNKYFKIQSGTSTSAYTSRDVKRRKVEEADAKLLSVHHARQKARVKRHNVLSIPLGGGMLYREFGLPRQDLISQILAEGLVPQKKLDWSSIIQGSEPSIFTIQSRLDIGPSIIDHYVAKENELVTIQYQSEKCSSSFPNRDRDSISRLVFNSPGRATSVCTHEESQKVVMTWLAGQENAGIAVTDWQTSCTTSRARRPPSILIGPGTSRGAEVSVFSSAAAPPASSVLFAIGTSHGLMKIDKQSGNASWLTPKLPRSEHEGFPRDTFALQFLGNDPWVLLSGGRRGILNVTDLRFPVYGDQADTIRHPSSITHIKQINNHQILVAGLNSSLCHYDLRFRKVDRPENCLGRHTGKNPIRSFTSPFLRYPDYFNTSIYQIGLDIDNESGLVAAAQQSKSGWEVGGIHLYSLRTGQLLRQIGKEKLGLESVADGLQVGRWMQSIQFVRNCENKAKRLYIGPSYSQDTIIFSL